MDRVKKKKEEERDDYTELAPDDDVIDKMNAFRWMEERLYVS